jgi:aldehyde:ferredoxin oxidoreductase
MNSFQTFYNMKTGVVDLSEGRTEVIPLGREDLSRCFGGAAVNKTLLKEHGDALVFGTGPLTGSFAPASSLLVATFNSPVFDNVCHVPFMLRTGPDMKFSGLDFLVVKGAASELSVLYVNHRRISIVPAGHLRNLNVPDVIGVLKKEFPPFGSAVVTGPAADREIPHAAASVGATGSLDKVEFASRMAAKNLKGIVFAGTGGLPFRKDHPDIGKTLIQKISSGHPGRNRGFASVLKDLDRGKEAAKPLRGLAMKNMACYHCPAPCMSYVRFARHEPSLLLLDIEGWKALSRKVGEHVFTVYRSCLKGGLDPAGVAQRMPDGGSITEWLLQIEKMMPEAGTDRTWALHPEPSGVPDKNQTLFGGGIAPLLPGDLWGKRVGLAMILGACPLFLLRFPQVADTDLLPFFSQDEGVLTNLQESLRTSVNDITAGE